MADLHAQLLAALDELARCRFCDADLVVAALRAVVELHKPEPYSARTPDGYRICKGCDEDGYDWEWPSSPCSTIQVIAEALGVKDGIEEKEQA